VKLRPYEDRSVRDLLKLLKKYQRVVAVGPTGCGKTVIGAELIRQKGHKRVLWVAHRVELLRQAVAQLIASGIPRKDVGILSGAEKINPSARVLVCSVGMFRERTVPKVDLVVVDEAHHVTAKSYTEIVFAHPRTPVLGLTATPQRLDGEPLGDVFNHLYVIAEAAELVADGYLLKSIVYGIPREKARDLVKDANGGGRDYSATKLETAMKKRPLMADIVSEWFRLAKGVATIVYACTRAHGQAIAKRFKKSGVAVGYLDGETGDEKRKELLASLASGSLQVVINVGVLTEGFDCPPVGCIIGARPTKSLTLWRQMCGRGARVQEGKSRYIVLDHAGNIWRHRFPDDPIEWSLNGKPKGGGEAPVKRCEAIIGTEVCGAINPISAKVCSECGNEFPVSPRELSEREIELERMRSTATERREKEEILRRLAEVRGLDEDWVKRQMAEVA
jgi:superfamily II DNA or RNA helicase